jgi:hypothetical protein
MPSKTNTPTPVVITFPHNKVDTQPSEADLAAARTYDAEIHELCRDTRQALQELRHGIINVLFDTLEKMGSDGWTLVQSLDERPSVVKNLIGRETDDLTTETLIDFLERLTQSQLTDVTD